MRPDFFERVRATVQRLQRAASGGSGGAYVIGVSGGVDSVVLLDVLVRAEVSPLVVAHVNHGLRGEASDADEVFVRSLAERYGCLWESVLIDVAERARSERESLETAGRQVRRAFFAEVAARHEARGVFLAHHADDQAESVLMNLLRGAGTRGLGGIRELATAGSLRLWRPLLNFRRSEIVTYAQARGLAWREDASNASREPLRNRLRHDVLPTLSQLAGRDVVPLLGRYASLAAEDEAWLDHLAEASLNQLRRPDGCLPVAALRELASPVLRRVLRRWLRAEGVPDVGAEDMAAAAAVIASSDKPASANLPGGWRVRRREGHVFLDRQSAARRSGLEP